MSDLKDKLNKGKGGGTGTAVAKSPDSAQTIAGYIKKMGPEIQRALPKHLSADRLARVALTSIRTNPQLLNCNIQSLLAAVMQCAQLGLEPGILGHAYLVPFWDNKANTRNVQFIIGYRGMIDLARRSGNIQSIAAHTVYAHDEFQFEYGLNENLVHKPVLEDRGEPYCWYAVARFKDGGHQILVLSQEDIEKIRERSKAKDSGPWKTDYEEMAKKTVIRAMFKYLPVSIEVMKDMEAADEGVRHEIKPREEDYIDVEVEYVEQKAEAQAAPAEEPEVAPKQSEQKEEPKPAKNKQAQQQDITDDDNPFAQD